MTGLFRDAGGLDYKIFHLINFIEIRLAGHEGHFLLATVRDVQPVHVLGNTMLGIYFEFVDSDMINLLRGNHHVRDFGDAGALFDRDARCAQPHDIVSREYRCSHVNPQQ